MGVLAKKALKRMKKEKLHQRELEYLCYLLKVFSDGLQTLQEQGALTGLMPRLIDTFMEVSCRAGEHPEIMLQITAQQMFIPLLP